MILDTESTKPIYIQIADWLKVEILSGNINGDEKIYSQYQLAEMFNINPATAAKGLNVLADESIVYKKRGLGMYVSHDARTKILKSRRELTLKKMVAELVEESKRLCIGKDELIDMIREEINLK